MGVEWWDLPGAAPQFATRRDASRDTLGPEVAKIMRQLGWPEVMPWQQYVLDVAYELDDDGRLVYRTIVEVVGRQAGKTAKTLGVQVHRATQMARRLNIPQRSLYTAQRHLDARAKLLEEHWPAIKRSPFRKFATPQRTTGSEGIEWSNGSQHHIAAPTWKAGHGGSIDLVQTDEAFVLQSDELEQGVKPTQITRKSPQHWILSAAGTHTSTYLRSKVDMGREHARLGTSKGIAYFEWSADGLDVDYMDPAVWRATHPAIGFTIDEEALAADASTMSPAEFARAYLAVWPTAVKPRIVSEEAWVACADPQSAPLDPVVFAFSVSPDRSMSAISVAGWRADGLAHGETIRHDHDTDWVVEEAHRLLSRHPKSVLVFDAYGPGASLLPEINRRRVPHEVLTTQDVARSMGLVLDRIKAGTLRHRDQVPLNVALAGADKRRIGDKWTWAWGDTDVTPLVSMTLALWALETQPQPAKFKMGAVV